MRAHSDPLRYKNPSMSNHSKSDSHASFQFSGGTHIGEQDGSGFGGARPYGMLF